ncbi:MAG TPA: NifB/NifX family molybdenum-iron cluster-binding protein [Thermodesulfobacteriota bacterium]|nr:NifB/NifX family molybdenum-iron cluster-binding protein [Thermodesulfobacteriota bacterium]
MRIAFPVTEDRGMDSPVYGHFGSAPLFIVLDSTNGALESLGNTDAHHTHGQCQPIKALGGTPVDQVVVGGIGGGALMKLQGLGIKVFRAVEGSVLENLELLKSGKLPEFAVNMTCAGHQGGQGCHHE